MNTSTLLIREMARQLQEQKKVNIDATMKRHHGESVIEKEDEIAIRFPDGSRISIIPLPSDEAGSHDAEVASGRAVIIPGDEPVMLFDENPST